MGSLQHQGSSNADHSGDHTDRKPSGGTREFQQKQSDRKREDPETALIVGGRESGTRRALTRCRRQESRFKEEVCRLCEEKHPLLRFPSTLEALLSKVKRWVFGL
ncbi:hypothetical protein GOP47_0022162 [Adiantum capillus-veneris]|uniref:Uncharacterized protein n=1 Tax=Adiantum capillus-veneris TaxID=13818 RepID=A0A9D4U9F8_ADICA|nr:hypothetical protein GOP47_0022162 [Adiantum capillus-veneris]